MVSVSTDGQVSSVSGGFELGDSELAAIVSSTLAEVEKALHDVAISADPLVTSAARHLVDAGGKRFRPMLLTMAAAFGDPLDPRVALAGTVVELTHLASLYHDDVMDEALVRRGAPSANARWGNSMAILVGDFLFAKAAYLGADLGIEAVRLHSGTFSQLVQGQISETIGVRDDEEPLDHYLRVIEAKTSSLIETSMRLGALFGEVDAAYSDPLAEYGRMVGMVFQLSDDLLDIASDSVQSGKTPGTDLREGVWTLPMLYALSSEETDATSVRLREILSEGPVTDDHLHAEALGLLRGSNAMKRSRETVQEYARRAKTVLAPLPAIPVRRELEHLVDYIADRTG